MTKEINDDVNEWCRIFQTEKGPVLYYFEYDTDSDEDVIHAMFATPIACLHVKLYDYKVMNQKVFDTAATQENADFMAKEAWGFYETVVGEK